MTSSLSLAFLGSVMIAALLASLALWSRRAMPIKIFALVATAAFAGIHYFALTDLLSRPKPVALEWSMPDPGSSTIVASQLRENQAIYLWLIREGETAPQAYQLPWSEELARQLHEAQREAENSGERVRMRDPREGHYVEGERVFYADPQKPLPEKQAFNQAPVAGQVSEGGGSGRSGLNEAP